MVAAPLFDRCAPLGNPDFEPWALAEPAPIGVARLALPKWSCLTRRKPAMAGFATLGSGIRQGQSVCLPLALVVLLFPFRTVGPKRAAKE